MTGKERLRALLDERGIEWWSVDSLDKVPLTICVIDGVRYKFRPQGRGIIVSSCTEGTVTPEQAIAATVGNGTHLSMRLREVHGLHAFAELFGFDWHDESDWSWHDVACAMADAIDATTEPDEATMLKLHSRMNAALLDMNEVLVPDCHREDISTQKLIDCVIAAHQIIEDAATVGVGTCKDVCASVSEFTCSECGFNCDLMSWISLFDGDDGRHRHHHHGTPNFCPNCGARVVGA